jgi:hypothetical protein
MPSAVILLAETRGVTAGDEAFPKRAKSCSMLSGNGAADIGYVRRSIGAKADLRSLPRCLLDCSIAAKQKCTLLVPRIGLSTPATKSPAEAGLLVYAAPQSGLKNFGELLIGRHSDRLWLICGT